MANEVGIDSLSIQITASTKSASSAIDGLVRRLEFLKTQLGGFNNANFNSQLRGTANALLAVGNASQQINSQNLKSAASGIRSLSNAMNNLQTDRFDSIANGLKSLSSANIPSLSGLGKLGTAMAKLAKADANNAADTLIKLVQPLNALSGVNIPAGLGANIADLGAGLAKLGGKKVVDAASSIPQIVTQLEKFSAIPVDASKAEAIKSIAEAFKSFGYKKVADGIANMPLIADAFSELVSKLNAMPTVKRNTIDLANAMASLAAQGGKVRSVTSSLTPTMAKLSMAMQTTQKHSFSLASAIGKVYASYWALFRAVGSIRKAINLASDLTEAQNVVLQAFGTQNMDRVDKWAKNLIQNFGLSELAAKNAASRFQAMGVAMGFSQNQMAEMSMTLVERAADIGSLYNKDFEDVAKDMNAVFTGMVAPMRKYGVDMTQASLKEWALNNGLNANIKSMTQMQKTMLRYQYVLEGTAIAQGDFARTSDTWANQLKILKTYIQALGTVIGSGFINLFKPVIKTINNAMNTILGLVEKTVNAIGKLMGWQMEVAPVKADVGDELAQAMEDTADGADGTASGLGKANKNAKELKRTILGFDQLNVLQKDKDSDKNSGSGSGAGGLADALGGDANKVTGGEMLLKPYESDIKSWFELGRKISDALAEAMESINWDSIYEKARNFGKGLAEFLNGLITPRLFWDLGATIAGALNTALHFLDSFGETFDWANLGLSIASGINGFFASFDFGLLADTINNWVQGIWTTITTALLNIDWFQIIGSLFELLTSIDPETYAILFGAWMMKSITSGIIQAFAGKSLSALIANHVSSMITTGLSNAWTFVSAAAKLFGERLVSAVVGGMSTGNFFEAFSSVFGVIPTVFAGIATAVGGTAIAVKNFFDMWQNGWNLLDEILKDLGIALGVVGAIILGAPALVAGVVGAIIAVVSTLVILIHDNWETIKGWFTTGLDYLRNLFAPVTQWVDTNMIQPIVRLWEGFKLRVSKIMEGLWILVKAVWMLVSGWFDQNVLQPLQLGFEKLRDKIRDIFEAVWNKIQEIFSPVFSWFDANVVQPIRNAFDTACSFIRQIFDNLWESIKHGVAGAFDYVITIIENKVNSVINFVNSIISAFNGLVSVAAGFTGDAWSGVPTVNNVHFARYANGGFIEDGLFTMNHGEIAGKFSNGQSVVANNQQITEGIKEAVIEGMMEVFMATQGSNDNTSSGDVILMIDSEEIARASIRGQRSIDKRFNPTIQFS